MADVDINKFRASVVRDGSKPASPGFIVSEGQDPVDPAGNGQNHLPVTIATAATGLSITESQVLGGAGTTGQYIRGDGSLADFPSSSGGGSSVSYYLNGSVNQGTIGGIAYKELNKVPILGAGTDFTINANGYIASFITDAGDPNLLEIPGGNWNFETYFSASSSGGSPSFYVELYKVNSGGTATLIASNSTFPELIAFGTNIISYFSTLAVPTTTLALTDRLAIRYYVTHSGRTITLHTEDNHLCQIITTFTTGITALNGLTAQVQNFAVGISGTDFAISSATATHTFNLPTASATNRGALSSSDWSMFNAKQNALTNPVTGTGTSGQVAYFTGTTAISSESNLFWDATNDRLGIGTATPTHRLTVENSADNTIFIVTAASGNIRHIFRTDSSQNAQIRTGNNVDLRLGVNEDAITIKNGGNVIVGINTYKLLNISDAGGAGWATTGGASTSPQLYLFGTGTSAIVQSYINNVAKLEVSNTGISVNGNIVLTNGANRFVRIGSATNYNYDLQSTGDDFQIIEAGATPRLTIKYPNGNIGINTITPATTLEVNGVGLFSGTSLVGNTKNGVYIYDQAIISLAGTGPRDLQVQGQNLRFFTGTTYGEKVRIFSDGNVLIQDGGTFSNNGSRLQVSGTSRFSGNVGIGVAPSYPLHISSNIQDFTAAIINTNVSDNAGLLIKAGVNTGNSVLRVQKGNGSDLFLVDASGNVGIGTANPTQPLQIGGTGNILLAAGGTLFSSGRLFIRSGSGQSFDFGANNTNSLMTLTSGGNLLIGTTNDAGSSQKLQVISTGSSNYLRLQTDNNASYDCAHFFTDGTNSVYAGMMRASSGLTGAFSIFTGGSVRVNVTAGGSVGINNSTPMNSNWGDNTSTKQLSIDASSYAVINLQGSTSRKYSMGVGDGNFYMCYDNTANRHNITVSSGGNVLINTTTSGSSKLRIVGLPTSSAGLSSGDVWSDSGTLKIA